MSEQRADYSVGQKIIHWLMAILLIMDLFVAQKFGGVMEEIDRLESRADHASLGTIVTILFMIRLYLRFRHGAPALPAAMSDWQVKAAKIGHGLLYFFIGFLILSGIATAVNAASPIALFGNLDITIGQTNEETFSSIRVFHEFATNAVITLIVLHVLAAFYHLVVMRDRLMQRMLKFWRSEPA
ncbi:MAG: cytochrome b [Pseudomonadota bacterium]